jgi:hypothetical protein
LLEATVHAALRGGWWTPLWVPRARGRFGDARGG